MRAVVAALFALLLSSVASLAQSPVSVIGPTTPGHCISFFSTTQIQDAGGACGIISGPGVSTVGDLAVWSNTTGTALADTGLSFPGGFSFAGTLTGATAVTFPTSGTLATTATANVASVTGTAGQITASPTTGAVVVGLVAPVSLANGGTNNAALTASAGGIVWSDASKLNILAGTSTAGQCLLSGNLVTPSWGACSSGGVASVSNADGTLTISPTTGAVVASIALGHANTWTAAQNFPASGITLRGSSTGVTTFTSANAGASNFTMTVPAATDQLVARATTDTLTNKTYNTAAAGNVFQINGTTITAISGNTGTVGTTTGAFVSGNCVKTDVNHNLVDNGAVCGGGGGGTPGGSTGQIQFNNAGAFGGFGLWDGSATTSLGNASTAQAFRVYNIVDTISGPTNFERGVLDFTTTANVLTIGSQAGGTGSQRALALVGSSLNFTSVSSGSASLFVVNNAFLSISSGQNIVLSNAAANAPATSDPGLRRIANLVLAVVEQGTNNLSGWLQWGGQARVTSDFSVTSSTVLTNVTGLTVNVQAGRTYTFVTELYVTDAAAGGVQAAIAGTATATAIQYTGYTIADNAIKGKANATALATAVGSTVTTETAGIVVRITGTITVNAAGTLTVQMAQNTSNGTATTAKRGSWLLVNDMP